MTLIMVYIPCQYEQDARNIANQLLERGLIACANIWPIRSLYMWKGELADEAEHVILGKTTQEKYEEIVRVTKSIHPYELPAIIQIPIIANGDYEKWLREQLTPK